MIPIYAWIAIYLCNLRPSIKNIPGYSCLGERHEIYASRIYIFCIVKIFDRFICLLARLWNHSARDFAQLKLFLIHDSRSTGKKEPKWNAWRRSYDGEWKRSGVRSSMEKWSDDTWYGGKRRGKGRGKPRAEAVYGPFTLDRKSVV